MNPVTKIALVAAATAGMTFAGVSAVAAPKATPLAQSMDNKDMGTIVATAKKAGNFTTLVKALQAADLVSTLEGEGPFTVFAPTDEAFKKLPAGTLDTLLKPENKQQLKDLLLYHVVKGKVTADKVVGMDEAQTVGGDSVKIKSSGGKVMLNDNVSVVKADVMASNGVIHAVDGVLMPMKKPMEEDMGGAGM